MNKNGRFKSKKVYFSQVSNHALRDDGLSLKAKGLYALIQSYITIENFVLYKATLKKHCKESDSTFEGSWKELKTSGYLVQEKHRNKNGNYYYIYELLDTVHPPKNQGVVKSDVVKPGGGKRGVFNNTDPNNTELNNTETKNTIYVSFPTDGHAFLKIYENCFRAKFGKSHKMVKFSDIDDIMQWIYTLESCDVDESDWWNAVEDHFASLPPKNDGGILAFMAASYRYFETPSPLQEAEF